MSDEFDKNNEENLNNQETENIQSQGEDVKTSSDGKESAEADGTEQDVKADIPETESEDYNKPSGEEDGSYRIAYSKSARAGGGNPDSTPPKRNKKNSSPILGIFAAFAVLALVIGGLIGVAKVTGAGSAVEANKEKQNETVALTKNDKTTEAAESNDTTGTSSETEVQNVTLSKNEPVGVTSNVSVVALDVSPVVEEVMPTIVAVTNTTVYTSSNSGSYWNWYYNKGSDDYETKGAGSGVIIAQTSEELMIATNAHVVVPSDYSAYGLSPESSEYSVKFCDDESVKAYLKGYDSDSDLAVIIVKLEDISSDTLGKIKIATIGDSDKLLVGNGVIAIGNALGFGQSVTVGYISALNREFTTDNVTRKLMQTDAAINPGNSGGGLFDTNGNLIGINSAKYAATDIEGIGFAIPINDAEEILTKIMNEETVIRTPVTDTDKKCYLGINAESTYSNAYEGKGAFVGAVVEGGPAEQAGIMAYDIISGINGVQVTGWTSLKDELSYYEGGETVTVTYYTLEENGRRRQYVEKECQVTLGFWKDYADEAETTEAPVEQ